MAKASITKRIRLTERSIKRATGAKKNRQEEKLAYLKTLDKGVRFEKGPKQQGQGGYR